MIGALTLLGAVFAESIDSRTRDGGRDPDDARVARHRAGDADAFAEIYRAHASAVYRRLSRILGPIAEREDLTQDVFLAVHKALPGFRGEAALATLIQRIAINVAYEHLRRKSRRPTALVESWFFDDFAAPGASPESQAAARQDLARVFACLSRIKPKKRIALLLRVVEGLSFQEIATLVDASVETAAKRVQHGQRELDALLVRAAREEGKRS